MGRKEGEFKSGGVFTDGNLDYTIVEDWLGIKLKGTEAEERNLGGGKQSSQSREEGCYAGISRSREVRNFF